MHFLVCEKMSTRLHLVFIFHHSNIYYSAYDRLLSPASWHIAFHSNWANKHAIWPSQVCIDYPAVQSDLSFSSCQRAEISHSYHGLHKAFKESCLISTESVNKCNDIICPRSWKQFLISLKQASVTLQIGVVVTVKGIRCWEIKICYHTPISTFGT